MEIYIVKIIDLNTEIYYAFYEEKIHNKILVKTKHSIDDTSMVFRNYIFYILLKLYRVI